MARSEGEEAVGLQEHLLCFLCSFAALLGLLLMMWSWQGPATALRGLGDVLGWRETGVRGKPWVLVV